MMNNLENKLTYNRISFCLSNSNDILEREMHPYHEILFFINGCGELLTATGPKKLKPNTLIIIPEETYHFFKLDSSVNFTRLKVSIPSDIVDIPPLNNITSQLKFVDVQSKNVVHILDRLCQIIKDNDKNSAFHAYSACLMLITELDKSNDECTLSSHHSDNKLINSLTEYISDNISENLSIDFLSQKMFISPSSLVHIFKKELGISLHQYITQKRLLYARKLIKEGNYPTKIYTEIGFKEYTSFYKSYKNFFGYPPSYEKQKKT